jgi:hypothetical protein
MKKETFDDVLMAMQRSSTRPFSLLLGNGFSMSYAPDIFSYNALHGFVAEINNPLLQALLRVIDTHDFERVMQQLDTFAALGDAFGIDGLLKGRIEAASADLKESLIDAIRALHPEHVYTIPEEKCAACAAFLKPFVESHGSLFTTNYDLLLYWVLMRGGLSSIDGFGRDRENPDEAVTPEGLEYSELRWGRNVAGQNVHYVHGALPLFDTGVEIVKEEYAQDFLLEQIAKRVDAGEYPVFVTAGNATQKLTHIRHNPYLQYSYEALASVEGSLVTLGFNFGEQDSHIVEAIQRATKNGQKVTKRLWSIYIGAYSDQDFERASDLASKFKCKVHVFDSATAGVWGHA